MVRTSVLLILCLTLSSVAVAQSRLQVASPGPGWEEANRRDDLVIFTKDNSSAGVREIRAIGDIDAPPKAVFAVLADFENYAKFMPYTKESKLIATLGTSELITYQLISPPLVSSRDYYIRVRTTVPANENAGVYKSEWTAVPDHQPERKDVVRVRINTGSWTLEPLDGGKRTRATYALLTHPGGSIPSWIANASNTTAIPDLFKAIRKRAGK